MFAPGNRRLRLKVYFRRCALVLLGALVAAWLGLRLIPIPDALRGPPPTSLQLTDRDGVPLRDVRRGEVFARPVKFVELPQRLVRAILAAEDKRFFEHKGVDWIAVGRATRDGFSKGRIVSGASTITQQLVKVSHPRRRTFPTKIIEALTAIRLEQLWTKERIFEEYLNRVDFGRMNVGIVAAADYYFGKPISDLSNAEAAFLAGLPKNPVRLNPYRKLDATRSRQRTVLQRMHANGWLSSEALARATSEAPRLRLPEREFRAPHFVDFVLRQVEGSGTVRTTLDLKLNQFVERQLRDQLARLHSLNVTNGAVVVIDNATSEVLALVGSEDYFAPGSGQFNGATARRSPGSTIKPFTYLLALERGATAATIYPDVPTEFQTPSGNYRVDNYQRRCSGPVNLRSALACSLNIPAVHALNSIGGPEILQRRLTEFGFSTLYRQSAEYGLGLTLGNAEAKLIDLANAYSALARMGEFRPLRVFAHESPSTGRLVANPRACWLLADILADNAARTPSFGNESPLRFGFPVACKTGTSTDYRDNWAVGYTPEFTVGVWTGNFDGGAMHNVSGVTGAAPVLHAVMEHLHSLSGTTWFTTPPGVTEMDVHPVTGKRLLVPRHDQRREKFLVEHLPGDESPDDYDDSGAAKLGPEYDAWLATVGDSITTVSKQQPASIRIVSPAAGKTFVIDPDLPGSRRVRLQAFGSSNLEWRCDSLTCRGDEALLEEGEHRVVAIDKTTGASAETWIKVKSL